MVQEGKGNSSSLLAACTGATVRKCSKLGGLKNTNLSFTILEAQSLESVPLGWNQGICRAVLLWRPFLASGATFLGSWPFCTLKASSCFDHHGAFCFLSVSFLPLLPLERIRMIALGPIQVMQDNFPNSRSLIDHICKVLFFGLIRQHSSSREWDMDISWRATSTALPLGVLRSQGGWTQWWWLSFVSSVLRGTFPPLNISGLRFISRPRVIQLVYSFLLSGTKVVVCLIIGHFLD